MGINIRTVPQLKVCTGCPCSSKMKCYTTRSKNRSLSLCFSSLIRFMFGVECSKSYNVVTTFAKKFSAGDSSPHPPICTFLQSEKHLIGKSRIKYQCQSLTFVASCGWQKCNLAQCVSMQIMITLKNFCFPKIGSCPPKKNMRLASPLLWLLTVQILLLIFFSF